MLFPTTCASNTIISENILNTGWTRYSSLSWELCIPLKTGSFSFFLANQSENMIRNQCGSFSNYQVYLYQLPIQKPKVPDHGPRRPVSQKTWVKIPFITWSSYVPTLSSQLRIYAQKSSKYLSMFLFSLYEVLNKWLQLSLGRLRVTITECTCHGVTEFFPVRTKHLPLFNGSWMQELPQFGELVNRLWLLIGAVVCYLLILHSYFLLFTNWAVPLLADNVSYPREHQVTFTISIAQGRPPGFTWLLPLIIINTLTCFCQISTVSCIYFYRTISILLSGSPSL